MAVFDRVKETTTSSGTGNITLLGAVNGFVTFTSRYITNAPFWYCIQQQSGSQWEVGIGRLSGSTTLVRDRVYASSNAGALTNFSAGTTKDVFVTLPAQQIHGKGKVAAIAMQLAGGN